MKYSREYALSMHRSLQTEIEPGVVGVFGLRWSVQYENAGTKTDSLCLVYSAESSGQIVVVAQ